MTNAVIVVSDTSVISNLIQIDQLSILTRLFPQVFIPPAVFGEIMKLNNFNISTDEFTSALASKRIQLQGFVDPLNDLDGLMTTLDRGESEAIILASELEAGLLLIDERLGRKKATERGLTVIGLLGVLRLAKQEKLIPYMKPLLDDLRQKAGFWFSDSLYHEVLKSVNE